MSERDDVEWRELQALFKERDAKYPGGITDSEFVGAVSGIMEKAGFKRLHVRSKRRRQARRRQGGR